MRPALRHPRQRGMGMAIALVLLALAGAAAAALGAGFAHEARRTRRELDAAQLRQLLLAGAAAAQARLEQPDLGALDAPVVLPPDLAQRGVVLRLEVRSRQAQAVQVAVVAQNQQTRERQTLRLEPRGGRWAVAEAHLNE